METVYLISAEHGEYSDALHMHCLATRTRAEAENAMEDLAEWIDGILRDFCDEDGCLDMDKVDYDYSRLPSPPHDALFDWERLQYSILRPGLAFVIQEVPWLCLPSSAL